MQLVHAHVVVALAALGLFAGSAQAYKVNKDSGTVSIVSVADFDKCARDFMDGDACLEGLKAYIEKQPKDAFAAGKHVRAQFNHWTALHFFSKAFAKGARPEQCSDPDVSMAVVSGLALPSDEPAVAQAHKIASEQCWREVQPALVAAFGDGSGGYFASNACPLAAEKKLAVDACKPKVEAKPAPTNTVATALKNVDWKQLALDPASGRLLRGRHGEEVYMIRTKPGTRELVLLKWKSVQGPWNGQVLVAIERPGGTGKDYVTLVDQDEWTAVTLRDQRYQAFAKGVREPIDLYEVALDRGQKKQPATGDVAAEFGVGAKPASTTAKR